MNVWGQWKNSSDAWGKEEAEKFAIRRKNLNELIHQKFYHPDKGIYSTGSQLDMCYPMLVGAVPDSLYDDVKER